MELIPLNIPPEEVRFVRIFELQFIARRFSVPRLIPVKFVVPETWILDKKLLLTCSREVADMRTEKLFEFCPKLP